MYFPVNCDFDGIFPLNYTHIEPPLRKIQTSELFFSKVTQVSGTDSFLSFNKNHIVFLSCESKSERSLRIMVKEEEEKP